MEQALHHSMTEIRNRQAITEALLSFDSLEEIMDRVAREISTGLRYDYVMLFEYLPDLSTIRGLAMHPELPANFASQFVSIMSNPSVRLNIRETVLPYEKGASPVVDQILNAETVVGNDLAEFFMPWISRRSSAAIQAMTGLQHLINVPLVVRGQIKGTMLAGRRDAPISDSGNRG